MSDIITTSGRNINTVTAEIVALSNQAAQNAWYSMVEIGRRLVEAKSMVDHGEWGAYLKNEVNFSQRSANNFMKIYQEYSKNPNSQTFVNLDYSKVVRLLAISEDDREKFMQEHDVASLSSRQLDLAIKERDAARKAQADAEAAAETARAEARTAERALLDAQQKAACAKNNESAWQTEIDKLNAALNKATAAEQKAKQQLNDLKANPKIPADIKAKIVAEAKAQSAAEVSAELETAQKQTQEAIQQKESAEKSARDAEQKLAEFQKSAMLGDPNIAALNLLFDQLQSTFNKANGYLMKISNADPARGAKFKDAFGKLLAEMKKKVE